MIDDINQDEFISKIYILLFTSMIAFIITMFFYYWFNLPPLLVFLMDLFGFISMSCLVIGIPAFIIAQRLPGGSTFLHRYICTFTILFIIAIIFLISLQIGSNHGDKWVTELKKIYYDEGPEGFLKEILHRFTK